MPRTTIIRLHAGHLQLIEDIKAGRPVGQCAKKSKPTRADRARALRDMALAIVRSRGQMETVAGDHGILLYRLGHITIALQTPFQRRDLQVPEIAKYLAAQRDRPAPEYLPYLIDVGAPKKVLSVQWADDGRFEIISYKRGEWESDLERLAGEEKAA